MTETAQSAQTATIGARRVRAALAVTLAAGLFTADMAHAAGKTVEEPGLKPYTIVDGTIPQPLTDKPGDPVAGKKVFTGRTKGNCLTCHTAPIPEEDMHGNVAPDLAGVADRLSAAEMRLRIVNPKEINPATVMFSYYHVAGLNRVMAPFVGKPLLAEQDIEDVIAYLGTLKAK